MKRRLLRWALVALGWLAWAVFVTWMRPGG